MDEIICKPEREVPFTRYSLPNGRRSETGIMRPSGIADMADEIRAAGYRFEVEILTTGDVSATIFDPEEEEDVAIETWVNAPGASGPAVDRLVTRFHAALKPRKETTP